MDASPDLERRRPADDKQQYPPFHLPRRTETRYSQWLLVRYANADAGARPLPPNTVFWESPDVWVVSPLGINMPVPGEPNQVFARVTNLGWKTATKVVVKFWWADPSLAITEANAHPIGIGYANIPSGYTVTVPCPTPWVPVLVNGGHECLVAEAYSPLYDPLVDPMDPVDDRHVGQKNEQLQLLQPGQQFHISLRAANIASLAQRVAVEIHPPPLRTLPAVLALRGAQFQRHALNGAALRPPAAILPVDLRIGDAALGFDAPSTQFARRLLALDTEAAAGAGFGLCAAPQAVRHETFEPWEARAVEITGAVPPDAKPGDSFAFRVLQRAGGMVVGGYTVAIVVAAPHQR